MYSVDMSSADARASIVHVRDDIYIHKKSKALVRIVQTPIGRLMVRVHTSAHFEELMQKADQRVYDTDGTQTRVYQR